MAKSKAPPKKPLPERPGALSGSAKAQQSPGDNREQQIQAVMAALKISRSDAEKMIPANAGTQGQSIDDILTGQTLNFLDAFDKPLSYNDAFGNALMGPKLTDWQDQLTSYMQAYNQPNLAPQIKGYSDAETRAATRSVFEFMHYNPQITNPWDALKIMTKAAQDKAAGANGGGGVGAHAAFRPMSDAAMQAGISSAFQAAYGRDPNPTEVAHFQNAYRGAERQDYNNQIANVSGPSVATPEQQTFADIQNTPEAFGHSARGVGLKLSQLIKESA